MARWLVQLEGERIDLEEYPRWFPDGDIYAVEENGKVYLIGPAFEELEEARQVHEAALKALDEFSALISLLEPNIQRPGLARVLREDENGRRKGSVFVSGSLNARSKMRAAATTEGADQDRPSPTQTQTLLLGSRADKHLRACVCIWADPSRTWPRLYRILEEVEMHLGQTADKVGLCSKNARKRFCVSANVAETSGKDARHALGKFRPPTDPMNLEEASAFVRELLREALDRAAAEEPSGGESERRTKHEHLL